jgi:hypothetical protein
MPFASGKCTYSESVGFTLRGYELLTIHCRKLTGEFVLYLKKAVFLHSFLKNPHK